MDWNFGDLLDATARVVPGDRAALISGDRTTLWTEFDQRSNRVARAMQAAGLEAGARVAILARNVPEFVEIAAATFKARLTYLTVNFRYTTAEIDYVLRDCRASALFFQDEFDALVAPLFVQIDHLTLAVCVGERPPAYARLYEELAGAGDGSALEIERSPDDGYLAYTGGTTGRPKGVMWRGADARAVQLESPLIKSKIRTMEDHIELVRSNPVPGRVIPACPLMHGAGLNSSTAELVAGGTVILASPNRFDAEEIWDVAERHRATRVLIVGDVFGRPLLQALNAHPRRWDLSSMRAISSAGLLWTEEVKSGLLNHLPQVTLVDILGASEASGFGYAMSTRDRSMPTGEFEPGARTVLIDSTTGRILGSDVVGVGLLGRTPPCALGYFNDPVKTAATYRVIDDIRYAVPGDIAARDQRGRLRLIGRGEMCINTGGEKVFPEEIEEALKRMPHIEDALVLGVPDEVWGRAVAALVCTEPGYDELRTRRSMQRVIASYKIPKYFMRVAEVPRHASGKADYRRARDIVEGMLRTQSH
jgi:acyl-CoA synthetase (AMP-forming)/AMP-acid ligase II